MKAKVAMSSFQLQQRLIRAERLLASAQHAVSQNKWVQHEMDARINAFLLNSNDNDDMLNRVNDEKSR